MKVVVIVAVLLCLAVCSTDAKVQKSANSACPQNTQQKLALIGQGLGPLLDSVGMKSWRTIMDPVCDCASTFLWVNPIILFYEYFLQAARVKIELGD